jgi:hypothetical protein
VLHGLNYLPIAIQKQSSSLLVKSNNDKSIQSHTFFSPTSHSRSSATAIADSGCTDVLITKESRRFLENLQPHTDLIVGTAAQGQFLKSTHKGELRIPCKKGDIILPGYVFNCPNDEVLKDESLPTKNSQDNFVTLNATTHSNSASPQDLQLENNLVGLAPLCNFADCEITLTKTAIIVTKDDEVVWQNSKEPNDTLWTLNFADLPDLNGVVLDCKPKAFQTIRHDTNAEYVRFVHAVFGSCPISTLLNAFDKGWLSNMPKITAKMIRQNPPVERATALGFLDQHIKGHNSTRVTKGKANNVSPRSNSVEIDNVEDEDEEVVDEHLKWQVIGAQELMNSSDATGRLPITTKSGWDYILVSTLNGYVHLQLLRDRSKEEYVRAYKLMYDYYRRWGHRPTIQRLDNETSTDLELFLRGCGVEVQKVPPGIHRQNPSERAIRHTKNCIIAMCVTADVNFPANVLYEEVVVQAEIIINQLRP